jgi:hypothetical protein
MPGASSVVMRRKKPMKAPFVVTVSAAAAAVAFVAGCNGIVEPQVFSNPPSSDPPPVTACSSTTQVGDACATTDIKCYRSGSVALECSNNNTWEPEPQLPTNPPQPPQEACPDTDPREGAPCSGTSLTCSYDDTCTSRPSNAGSSRVYSCVSFIWKRQSAPYVAACPAAPPQHGESCAPCALDLPAQCNYNANPSGCPPTIANCDPKTLTWQVAISTCNPPPPDAGAP